MAEMLGVLAVVGVLSIGGIAGYTTAMNHYRGTEVMNDVNTRVILISTEITTNGVLPANQKYDLEIGHTNSLGQNVDVISQGDSFMVQVSGIDKTVCRYIVHQDWDVNMYAGFDDTLILVENADDCVAETVDMGFEFSNEVGGVRLDPAESCPDETPVWDEETSRCVECTAADSSKCVTVCGVDNTCIVCIGNVHWIDGVCQECAGVTSVWNGDKCVACTLDDDPCTTECDDNNTCVPCDAPQHWDDTLKCVDCTAHDHCATGDCNLSTGVCCADETPYWSYVQRMCTICNPDEGGVSWEG